MVELSAVEVREQLGLKPPVEALGRCHLPFRVHCSTLLLHNLNRRCRHHRPLQVTGFFAGIELMLWQSLPSILLQKLLFQPTFPYLRTYSHVACGGGPQFSNSNFAGRQFQLPHSLQADSMAVTIVEAP